MKIAPYRSERYNLEFRSAENRTSFFKALEDFKQKLAVLTTGYRPILHVESHGHEEGAGLLLGSGEFVRWDELRPYLREANTRTRFNFLVVMAACNGFSIVHSVPAHEGAPFWGAVGPNKSVYDVDMSESFAAFYSALLSTYNGTIAFQALNEASIATGGDYKFVDAESAYCYVFHTYVREATTEDVELRVEGILAEWLQSHSASAEFIERMRAQLRAAVNDHAVHFGRLRREFLMLDLFPENEQRFTTTYDDCREAVTKAFGEHFGYLGRFWCSEISKTERVEGRKGAPRKGGPPF